MLESLFARRRFGIRPGTERVRLLLDRLGHPERTFRTIHVVGTNGKGSTSAFLSAILTAAGKRAALFTSPHLIDFTERFRIDEQDIDRTTLADRLKTVLELAPPEATFFEIVTALGAFCFAEERVELAIMEAGMGGMSDATAALPGIMTLISPVAIDHSDYLGTTPEEIAREKIGIAEAGSLVVSAHQTTAVNEVIDRHCAATGTRLFRAGRDFTGSWSVDGTLAYRGIHATLTDLMPGLTGSYQAGNAALALAAAELLASYGVSISTGDMMRGIAQARWPGRMQLIPGPPDLLFDGAHNTAGMAALADALMRIPFQRLFLVAGVMEDKEIGRMFAPLIPKADYAFTVRPSLDRALDDRRLTDLLSAAGLPSHPCGNVAEGLQRACSQAAPGDLILVCGSLFTVGEALAHIQGRHFQGIRG